MPGLVFALEWPEVRATLLDGQLRRTAWLRTAVARLGLADRVDVVEGRGGGSRRTSRSSVKRFPLVLARGFGPPTVDRGVRERLRASSAAA